VKIYESNRILKPVLDDEYTRKEICPQRALSDLVGEEKAIKESCSTNFTQHTHERVAKATSPSLSHLPQDSKEETHRQLRALSYSALPQGLVA
jgi:hypothetical protein